MPNPHSLELLSPARDVSIAREAILHGADAIYIGGPGFGARHGASNSLADIAGLVCFARAYRVRIFVTLNTILHDDELKTARQLIWQLYEAGVDALIVQDMGILEMDIPPIELHASTQCDIRTPEKARFLADAGFSQLVVARELSLPQVQKICASTDATIEFFIHGALCVAFSGQCYISHAQTGRSANRGDCSQACRLPYTLKDSEGRVVAYEKHLLSLKDNNQTANLEALVNTGVRSFKIEGRYKDMGYVKNITAWYRQQLDRILSQQPHLARASSGHTEHFFIPDPERTFNRGSTDYFVNARQPDIGAFETPAFTGLPIGEITSVSRKHLTVRSRASLANGDGLNILHKREITGFRASVVTLLDTTEHQGETCWQYRIEPHELPEQLRQLRLPYPLNRNLDHNWQQALSKTSAERRIGVSWQVQLQQEQLELTVTSEEGIRYSQTIQGPFAPASQPEQALQQLRNQLERLGTTIYHVQRINLQAEQAFFIPNSQLKNLRRDVIAGLDAARLASYPRGQRKPACTPPPLYPETHLSFLANVYNEKSRAFYQKHGIQLVAAAYEAHQEAGDVPLMITRHCLRFSFNLCPKQARGMQGVQNRAEPMQLLHQNEVLTLQFDCKACEMHVMGRIKKQVLDLPPPGSHAAEQSG